jgi:GNAT superfamily N-acetyltransferase
MRVRQIQPSDAAVARRLRLDSLADAPDAFAATVQEELATPEAHWEERVRSNAEGISTVGFFAVDDGGECGLVVGVRLAGEPPSVALNALWVAPRARRLGAARALVDAVERWARARGATHVVLQVTEASHAARALYASADYVPVAKPASTCGRRGAPSIKLHKRLPERTVPHAVT